MVVLLEIKACTDLKNSLASCKIMVLIVILKELKIPKDLRNLLLSYAVRVIRAISAWGKGRIAPPQVVFCCVG